MKKRIICMFLLATLVAGGEAMAETWKSIQYRIENMHCGGCAGRVKKALSAKDGVDKIGVDLEKRVVTVNYDADKITPDILATTLTEAKYAPAAYSAKDVIERTVSFKASEMRCGGCANKVKTKIGAVSGVKSVDVDLDHKSVKITYDANQVSRNSFKGDFQKFGYTVTAYYPNEIVAYSQFKVEKGKLGEAGEEAVGKVKGIIDVTANEATKVLAVAYNTKVLDAAGVRNRLAALGYTLEAE